MAMCVCIKESDAGETVEINFRVYPPHSAARATNLNFFFLLNATTLADDHQNLRDHIVHVCSWSV